MTPTVVANPPKSFKDLDPNHSHYQIVQRIPRYAQVLELGCGDGTMSRLMKEQCQAKVFGVEKDAELADQAKRYCDYVFTEDLDDPHSLDALQFEKFDVITLVDVLEHLKHPQSLLERLKPFLMDESVILLSVPNVAHVSVRLELLTGDFRYEDAGILDSTHLKFFTLKTLKSLVERSGFSLNEVDYTWHDIPDTVISRYLRQVGVDATPRILDYFHKPDAVAYQFILSLGLPLPQSKSKHSDENRYNLKPMAASWDTWGKVFSNLQQKQQIINGLQLQMQEQQRQLERAQHDLKSHQEELGRVYATRSWRLLRSLAGLWRGEFVQDRLTTHC
ncbi:class I SAM-dependent methyltransferase [Thiolinea disciformis]|uniref:class I SAM-dependent methyltransferase n=1 Tax=Thiolinea disciformis TaxID=125614 RepID=UPI0003812A4B|nr:class I SAM-dependent methyltransferase [Thiolinea disciformis]